MSPEQEAPISERVRSFVYNNENLKSLAYSILGDTTLFPEFIGNSNLIKNIFLATDTQDVIACIKDPEIKAEVRGIREEIHLLMFKKLEKRIEWEFSKQKVKENSESLYRKCISAGEEGDVFLKYLVHLRAAMLEKFGFLKT